MRKKEPTQYSIGYTTKARDWTVPKTIDTSEPHFEARSNASGLIPPIRDTTLAQQRQKIRRCGSLK